VSGASGGDALGGRAAAAYTAAAADSRAARIEAHLALLGRLARRIHSTLPPGSADLDELLSWGAIGLCQGVDSYDPGRGVPLEAYVRATIRHAIMDGLREADRLPRRMREKERRLRQVVAELEQRFMRSPTPDEVAAALGGDEASVADHYAAVAFSSLGYLDEELPDDGDGEGGGASRLERIADEGAADPVERAEAEERRRHLMAALARLSERERRILWAVYQEDYTLTEVARVLGLSVSQLARIHAHAILRLRGMLSRYVAESRRDGPRRPPGTSEAPTALERRRPVGRSPPARADRASVRGRWQT
jgi:RNA polymerase sigma factor for flagellar operon FliA